MKKPIPLPHGHGLKKFVEQAHKRGRKTGIAAIAQKKKFESIDTPTDPWSGRKEHA